MHALIFVNFFTLTHITFLTALGDLQDEITSIPESHYSYSSDGNPDLELLICASSGYGAVDLPYHCQDDDVMETPRDTGCGSLTSKLIHQCWGWGDGWILMINPGCR